MRAAPLGSILKSEEFPQRARRDRRERLKFKDLASVMAEKGDRAIAPITDALVRNDLRLTSGTSLGSAEMGDFLMLCFMGDFVFFIFKQLKLLNWPTSAGDGWMQEFSPIALRRAGLRHRALSQR
jgi:hypothetical protein